MLRMEVQNPILGWIFRGGDFYALLKTRMMDRHIIKRLSRCEAAFCFMKRSCFPHKSGPGVFLVSAGGLINKTHLCSDSNVGLTGGLSVSLEAPHCVSGWFIKTLSLCRCGSDCLCFTLLNRKVHSRERRRQQVQNQSQLSLRTQRQNLKEGP